MKKALAIGLAAAMAVTMTAPVYASDDSESGKGIAKEDLKIGAIYIGDENEGYTAAHMAGIDEMQEALGIDDSQVIEKTLIGEDEGCYDAAADLADQGCQIIFANSFGHETYILEAAGEYPAYSSVMQPELRQHQADFPICTTTSQTFMKLVMCPV